MSKKKHPILATAAVLGTAVLTIEAINRIAFAVAEKNALSYEEGEMHTWTHGDFFYKKKDGRGEGRPILILHDLYPDQSAEQNEALANQLAKKRTVYTMDLLGCGRSAKPAIIYTNFVHVLQVVECVEKIIGQPVHLVAKGRSALIAIAAANYKPEYFTQLTLLDPPKEEESKKIPDEISKCIMKLIQLPIFGTLVYNIAFGIHGAAHMGGQSARYLYASIAGHYTNYDVAWMLDKIPVDIHIVETSYEWDHEQNETDVETVKEK